MLRVEVRLFELVGGVAGWGWDQVTAFRSCTQNKEKKRKSVDFWSRRGSEQPEASAKEAARLHAINVSHTPPQNKGQKATQHPARPL